MVVPVILSQSLLVLTEMELSLLWSLSPGIWENRLQSLGFKQEAENFICYPFYNKTTF